MTSGPVTGLWHRLKRAYFSAQYIKKRPIIANKGIIGCRETKKQRNR